MTDNVQSFLQEIDDSMRVEKFEKFWQESGKLVLAGCVGVVLITLASALWRNHVHTEQVLQTDQLLSADTLFADGKSKDAIAVLEEVEKGPASLATLARLKHAEILTDSNDFDKALLLYKEVADDKSIGVDNGLRDFARMQADIIASNRSGKPPQENTINSDPSSPFGGIPNEIKALRLIKAGKNNEARALLGTLVENNALTKSERLRALEIMDTLPAEDKK